MDNSKGKDMEYKIINKSFDLFLNNGYEKTTIRQIANEVGITRGHLYYYFKKKEDILLHICRTIISKIYELINIHNKSDEGILLNYAITQCLYTYTIVGYEKLFRIYLEGSKVSVIKKEYGNILIDLFKKNAHKTNYDVDEKDIYISVTVGCSGEEELLRRYYDKEIDLSIEDIIKSVITTRLLLLNIIDKKEVDKIVAEAMELAKQIDVDELLRNFDLFVNTI